MNIIFIEYFKYCRKHEVARATIRFHEHQLYKKKLEKFSFYNLEDF